MMTEGKWGAAAPDISAISWFGTLAYFWVAATMLGWNSSSVLVVALVGVIFLAPLVYAGWAIISKRLLVPALVFGSLGVGLLIPAWNATWRGQGFGYTAMFYAPIVIAGVATLVVLWIRGPIPGAVSIVTALTIGLTGIAVVALSEGPIADVGWWTLLGGALAFVGSSVAAGCYSTTMSIRRVMGARSGSKLAEPGLDDDLGEVPAVAE